MKKLLTLSMLALICASGFAQQVVLVFTGQDATTNQYVQLSRIEITDLTQGWTENLYYPDTMAILTVGTGIAENAANGVFGLSQNNPNPFNGTTDVNLTVADPGEVAMEITDANGRLIVAQNTAIANPGTHRFRVNVAATGIYFLTARQNGKTSSVKMVNNGNGTGNGIEYAGTVVGTQNFASLQQTKNGTKGAINHAFAYGDAMTYRGFAEKYGMEIEGQIKAQTQILSETITLLIDYSTVPNPNDGIPCSGTPTLTDVDGNTYNTVLIGEQCWMKENLRTTRYADSTPIALGTTYSSDVAYRYAPDNNSSNVVTYGYLYNWKAVMRNSSSNNSNPSGVQGICPTGWHVPSDAEWTQLTDYVSSQSQYYCSGNTNNIAKALASQTGWSSYSDTCCVGDTPSSNNATGFGALPAGHYNGSYYAFGNYAYFWSAATEYSSDNPYGRTLAYDNAGVYRYDHYKGIGVSVRCVRDESFAPDSAALPTVTTNSVSNITEATATCGVNVAADGGATTVTARGVCWSTSQNPTVSDSHTTDGTGTGSFTSSITGLSAGTTYYVRAYATNSAGTAYGEQRSFTTSAVGNPNDGQPCPGTPTLTDVDGNTYNTVLIGSQCWMKENLKTTKYADGTPIEQGSTTSTEVAYWYYPNNAEANKATYGLLYNWKATMGDAVSTTGNLSNVQGICPTGWHVPSDAEWTQLTVYVSGQSAYCCSGNTSNIAKALASTTGWDSSSNTCTVGNTPSSNNATGFSALPAGYYYNGWYNDFGYCAHFWSATEFSSTLAFSRLLFCSFAGVTRTEYDKVHGYSVRCVRDASGTLSLPTVTTSNVTNITGVNATCGGNVTADGGASVTSRGVCWSTSQNPTVSDSHTTDGTGTGSFTSSITGLSAVTTYYVRAYATNSVGTSYGEQRSFTTSAGGNPNDGQPCPGAPTLTDVDGNTYNTVQIGNQCWMKENLRTTRYADNTTIALGTTYSSDVAYRYAPDNNSSNVATYGYLYNWPAVMRNASSSSANPSGVQGICPNGWHVPSDAEWTQLTNYVSSQSSYCCSGNTDNIAKALASTTGWNISTTSCAVGNAPSSNNATGFSALPAGYYYGSYNHFGTDAHFWSATEFNSTVVDKRVLDYGYTGVIRSGYDKAYGYSVRCVRDPSGTLSLPTVTTSNVTNITEATATCGCNVTAEGGATVTARGVCWSTSQTPWVSDSHTTDGTGTGSFTSSITGLSAVTTYYVRAYATNSAGTAYGEQRSFTTSAVGNPNDGQPCPGTPTLTDVDGNTYNTVLIGSQCWMKENLKTTKYADGTPIENGSVTSDDVAYWYYPNNVEANKATYGLLYNWKATMGDAVSTTANPSNVQGICPTGWHVPSDAEWTQLTDYVRSQSAYCCSGYTSNIAKALASQTGWSSFSDTCCVGDTPSSNNATGFSALPAGCNIGGYTTFGSYAYFWSATENSSDRAYDRGLSYNFAGVGRANEYKTSRCSVRCVRD